jgi:hypothetical protein
MDEYCERFTRYRLKYLREYYKKMKKGMTTYEIWMEEGKYEEKGNGYFNCLDDILLKKIFEYVDDNSIVLANKKFYAAIDSYSKHRLRSRIGNGAAVIAKKYPNRYRKWSRIYHKYYGKNVKSIHSLQCNVHKRYGCSSFKTYGLHDIVAVFSTNKVKKEDYREVIYSNGSDTTLITHKGSLIITYIGNVYVFDHIKHIHLDKIDVPYSHGEQFKKLMDKILFYKNYKEGILKLIG